MNKYKFKWVTAFKDYKGVCKCDIKLIQQFNKQ